MPISWLDVILVVIMLISGFLAMLRGLTREVLSILSWAVAALATLYFFPKYQSQVRLYIEPPLLGDAILAAGIFLVVLIIVSLITSRISDKVLDSRVGALDRTLGFIFGLARGLVLVVIAFLFFSWLVPEDTQPQWIRTARSLPILQKTGDAIVSLLPEDPAAHLPGQQKDEAPPSDQPTEQVPRQRSEAESGSQMAGSTGYGSGTRRGLNQLFESSRASSH